MSTYEPNQERIRDMSKHPDTIGNIDWSGETYRVDWPFNLDDETTRDESLGVIYLDGEKVGEFNDPLGPLTDKGHVMRLAWACVSSGETDDQS